MAAAEGARGSGPGEAPVVPRQMEQAHRAAQQKVVVIRPHRALSPRPRGQRVPEGPAVPLRFTFSKIGVGEGPEEQEAPSHSPDQHV